MLIIKSNMKHTNFSNQVNNLIDLQLPAQHSMLNAHHDVITTDQITKQNHIQP